MRHFGRRTLEPYLLPSTALTSPRAEGGQDLTVPPALPCRLVPDACWNDVT